jgi:hypothetical protein
MRLDHKQPQTNILSNPVHPQYNSLRFYRSLFLKNCSEILKISDCPGYWDTIETSNSWVKLKNGVEVHKFSLLYNTVFRAYLPTTGRICAKECQKCQSHYFSFDNFILFFQMSHGKVFTKRLDLLPRKADSTWSWIREHTH